MKDQQTQTLLLLGPLPPPVGGGTRTVQVFLAQFALRQNLKVVQINTSPYQGHRRQTKVALGHRTYQIVKQYLQGLGQGDVILIFGTNSFIQTLLPLLFLLAKFRRKPLYLKPFGGNLDDFIQQQQRFTRSWLLQSLRRLDGIFMQTQQGQAQLWAMGCHNSIYLPGCRPKPKHLIVRPSQFIANRPSLRLVFLSQIRREKGIFTLFAALRQLAHDPDIRLHICCDFYGPIHADIKPEFQQQIQETPGTAYGGIINIEDTVPLMATYDLFVLPTFYAGEGHPGAIIEAMQAGLPIVATQYRAIPEIVKHGENGLLIPIKNDTALAKAIKTLALNPNQRYRMAQANLTASQAFRADKVVGQALAVMFGQA